MSLTLYYRLKGKKSRLWNVDVFVSRESLKGSSQVVRISSGKIAFSCLQRVNKTHLTHMISHNLGRAC